MCVKGVVAILQKQFHRFGGLRGILVDHSSVNIGQRKAPRSASIRDDVHDHTDRIFAYGELTSGSKVAIAVGFFR